MTYRHLAWALSIVLGLAAGCEPDPRASGQNPAGCFGLSALDVEGEWTVTGDGSRQDCERSRDNGSLHIEAVPFLVGARAVPTDSLRSASIGDLPVADAFVERIKRSGFMLERANDRQPELEFSGSSLDCDINFRLRETLPEHDALVYDFTGTIEDARTVRGQFRGRGPGSCVSFGDFEVQIR